ncbi:hypothetical protein DMC30DRAFT_406711 [Rhodotorula diobovata]|uniref:Uncharacterized protein n=1 Tax=Rhodotorula diobovata TaxID=5288 RepID=A0A5C5FLD4_9BASI|nr:hypothetical protein DMC30DRAFT_406711 [Rhodotorula diobovata]
MYNTTSRGRGASLVVEKAIAPFCQLDDHVPQLVHRPLAFLPRAPLELAQVAQLARALAESLRREAVRVHGRGRGVHEGLEGVDRARQALAQEVVQVEEEGDDGMDNGTEQSGNGVLVGLGLGLVVVCALRVFGLARARVLRRRRRRRQACWQADEGVLDLCAVEWRHAERARQARACLLDDAHGERCDEVVLDRLPLGVEGVARCPTALDDVDLVEVEVDDEFLDEPVRLERVDAVLASSPAPPPCLAQRILWPPPAPHEAQNFPVDSRDGPVCPLAEDAVELFDPARLAMRDLRCPARLEDGVLCARDGDALLVVRLLGAHECVCEDEALLVDVVEGAREGHEGGDQDPRPQRAFARCRLPRRRATSRLEVERLERGRERVDHGLRRRR